MARIEIELTSSRPDGTWTWRAVGAKQPKGTLAGSLVGEGAKVGDEYRAETRIDMDGIQVTSLLPRKAKRPETDRLPYLGPPPTAPGAREPMIGDTRAESGSASPGAPGRRPARPSQGDRERGRRPSGRPDQRGRPGGGPERTGDESRGGGRTGSPRQPRTDRPARAGAERSDGPRGGQRDRRGAAPARSGPVVAPRAKRLHAGRIHRDALLASLAAEQRPIAEQVLRGGIPAVRQAVEEHNAKARAVGQPEVKAGPLVALAEDLLPSLRAAEWRDRAEAALADVDEVSLRDLRAVVAGSDAAGREDADRDLALRLREASDRRNNTERDAWLDEIRGALGEGRVVRALRISSRPPEPGSRFPADLTTQLSSAAGSAMGPDVAPDRWAAVLDAVLTSPVRLSVKPEGVPKDPGDALTAAIRQGTARVPGLKDLLPRPVPPAKPRQHEAPPTPPAGDQEVSLGDDRKDPVLVEELGQPVDQP